MSKTNTANTKQKNEHQ